MECRNWLTWPKRKPQHVAICFISLVQFGVILPLTDRKKEWLSNKPLHNLLTENYVGGTISCKLSCNVFGCEIHFFFIGIEWKKGICFNLCNVEDGRWPLLAFLKLCMGDKFSLEHAKPTSDLCFTWTQVLSSSFNFHPESCSSSFDLFSWSYFAFLHCLF